MRATSPQVPLGVHTVLMRGVGVGVLFVTLWLLTSVPLGMLIGAGLGRHGQPRRALTDIPRQRAEEEGDGFGAPVPEDHLLAPLRNSVRSGVTALAILVGALAFTVGTAAAVSSLPGPTPPAVAGVIKAVTPFRVDPQVTEERKRDRNRARPLAADRKSAPRKPAKHARKPATATARPQKEERAPQALVAASPSPSPTASPESSAGSLVAQSTASPSASASPTASNSASPSASPTESAEPTPSASPSPTSTTEPLLAPSSPSLVGSPSATPAP